MIRLPLLRLAIWLLPAVLITGAAPALAQTEGEPAHRDATFKVFLGGRPVGSQTVLVDVSDTEWRVRVTGQLTPPLAFLLRSA